MRKGHTFQCKEIIGEKIIIRAIYSGHYYDGEKIAQRTNCFLQHYAHTVEHIPMAGLKILKVQKHYQQ